jgi:CYTH domain-containing protein
MQPFRIRVSGGKVAASGRPISLSIDRAKGMTKEIERKFLVRNDGWRRYATAASDFRQGYLTPRRDKTSIRVRLIDGVAARLTLKIARVGLSRDEFEYDIPLEDANQLLEQAVGNIIEKTRYKVLHRGFTWEIDVFRGIHYGLITAEVEMRSENDSPSLPGWLGREVTGEKRYSNRTLAAHAIGSLAIGRIRIADTQDCRRTTDPTR